MPFPCPPPRLPPPIPRPSPLPCPGPVPRPMPYPPPPALREGFSEFDLIAFTGQALKQSPHLVQSALFMYALPAFITIAPSTGQALIHSPHPVHISSLTQGNLNISFFHYICLLHIYYITSKLTSKRPLSQISGIRRRTSRKEAASKNRPSETTTCQ